MKEINLTDEIVTALLPMARLFDDRACNEKELRDLTLYVIKTNPNFLFTLWQALKDSGYGRP